MRLPLPLLDSQFFLFNTLEELAKALGDIIQPDEISEIVRMAACGLPPVTSRMVLATMFGINPGLIWSFENRTLRHYRSFTIPKGRSVRRIDAPKVALKIVQKWFSVQLSRLFTPADHVYGFVSGRSHIDAAKKHCDARWVFSVDIKDFFQTTPISMVEKSLIDLGFNAKGAQLLSSLCCLRGFLAQGAPSSPILSNICFQELDRILTLISVKHGVRMTRYADDIVLSGSDSCPPELAQEIEGLFTEGPWRLAEHKTRLDELPNRLKVHGMLVHGEFVRLTKGYRNKLRAYRHLMAMKRIQEIDIARIRGHLTYSSFVEKCSNWDYQIQAGTMESGL